MGEPLTLAGQGHFTKYYLGITREEYQEKKKAGFFDVPADLKDVLRLQTVPVPATADEVMEFLNYVGAPWGWPNRVDYQPDRREKLEADLRRDDARLWQFLAGGKNLDDGLNVAGFCLVRSINLNAPDKHPEGHKKDGLTKKTVERLFRELNGKPNGGPVLEIDKIGIHDMYTGYGLGRVYLGQILGTLFNTSQKKGGKPCVGVILDTRSTNHAGVLKFYQDCGFSMLTQERRPSDLVSLPVVKPRPPEQRYSMSIEEVMRRHDSGAAAGAAPTPAPGGSTVA